MKHTYWQVFADYGTHLERIDPDHQPLQRERGDAILWARIKRGYESWDAMKLAGYVVRKCEVVLCRPLRRRGWVTRTEKFAANGGGKARKR